MDKFSFLEITACIGIFVILFLALFLLTVKTKHKLGNRLFAFFLIANAIDASKFLIHHIPDNLINLEVFRWSIVYLVPAAFYLYVMSVCYSNFWLKPKHLLHAIPFIAYNLNLISGVYFETTDMKLHFIKNMNQMPIIHFFQFLFELLFQVYFIASFLVIRKSRTVYFENYTNPNISIINALYKITILYYL
ncbi:MAG TPA: AraC family transcriptional regulator, partial [Chryseobacterium sp.]